MVGPDELLGELRGALARLGHANAQVAAAAEHARQVRHRAVNAGFQGVAQGMTDVERTLRSVFARLNGAGDGVTKTVAPVQAVINDPSPEQVLGRLHPLIEQLSDLGGELDAVVTELQQCSQRVAAVLRGGKPGPLLSLLDSARHSVRQAAQQLDLANRRTTRVVQETTQVGNVSGGVETSESASTVPSTAPRPVTGESIRSGDGFHSAGTVRPSSGGGETDDDESPVPAWALRLAGRLSPLGPGVKAVGIATTPNGTPLTDEPITNGSAYQIVDNARTLRTDLRPWSFPGNVALSHVEGHVAAVMREPGAPQEVVLIMSRPPCGGKFGCDASLPKLLPVGATLTIHVRQPNGTVTYHATYRGNGSGVKR